MTTTIPARMGKRYECRNGILGQGGSSVFHDKGDGSPTRRKCSYCGGDFEVFEGLYGAFEWVQGGRYEPAAALYWGTKRDAVDKWIEANGGNYVSRWIDARALTSTAAIEAHGTCARCHEQKVLVGGGAICQECSEEIQRGEPLERLEGAKVASQIDDLIGEFAKALPASSDDEVLKIWGLASDMQRQTNNRVVQDALAAFRGVIMAEMQRRGIESRASKTAADDIAYWSGGLLSSLWQRFLEWLLVHNGSYDSIDGAFASLNAHASYGAFSVEGLTQAYYAAISEARENLDRWGDTGQGPRQTIYAIEAEFDRRNLPRPAWPRAAAKVIHNPCPNCGDEVRFIGDHNDPTIDYIAPWTCDGCGFHGVGDDLDAAEQEARDLAAEASERHSRGGPFGLMTEAVYRAVTASASSFKAIIDPALAQRIPDDVAAAMWDRLMNDDLPAHILDNYESGKVNLSEARAKRARELATNYLIDQQATGSKRAANESTCPACGVDAVEYQPYPSAQLVCNACGWSGQRPPEGMSWDCANEWHSRCQGCACSHHQTNRTASNESGLECEVCGKPLAIEGDPREADLACPECLDEYLSHAGSPGREFMRAEALGEVKAPPDVDTLRDEQCPVCGETDGFTGDECAVCGYKKPPSFATDPDTERASREDLRKGQEAQGEGLEQFRVDGPASGGTNDSGSGLERFRVAYAQDDPHGTCINCGHLGNEHTATGCDGCKAAGMVECGGFEDARRYAAKTYKPFCSIECNREYHASVAAPDTANNTEPYCLNCGKATEPSMVQQASWPSPQPSQSELAFGEWWAKNGAILDEDVAWDTFVAVSGERAR